MSAPRMQGFTLIEVLLALSILAIALTALLKAQSASVVGTHQLQQTNTAHTVALQGIARIQLGLAPIALNQTITEKMHLFGADWYWRARISATGIPSVEQITVTTSTRRDGPFLHPCIAFRPAK